LIFPLYSFVFFIHLLPRYVPEPYYTQGSDVIKTAFTTATGYRTAAEKYAHDTYETALKTRADYEKKVAEAQEKAFTTAKASYDTYAPPPVKATVSTSYTTATQTAAAVQKRVLETREYVAKTVEDTQKLAYAKAEEAQQRFTAGVVEAATSAYKTAEPYIAPVQAKAFELVKTYHIDEKAAQIVQQYHLDQHASEIVAFAEKRGVPVPAAVKSYLPAPAPFVTEEAPKENGTY